MIPDSEALDPELLRRFAGLPSVPDGEAFVGRVEKELGRLRRARRWRRGVASLLAAGLLVSVTPWVVSLSLSISGWTGTALAAPWTWVLSVPLGFWILRRSRARV